MANNDNPFGVESPENFEQKSICCFVLDVSGSMNGQPIDELNRGLQEFHSEIVSDPISSNRLEVAIITFDSTVNLVLEPSLVDNFNMPTLTTKGSTKLVDGVREGIRIVEDRKNWYKQTGQPYLRPWIILVTDGFPDFDQDVDSLQLEIEQASNEKKFVFLPIGVGGADMSILNKISGSINEKKIPAMKIQGLKFFEFFEWVSASMSSIASSKEGDNINLPDPSEWMEGFKI
ncbi:hypothetical protein GCM10011344_42760 [Dokdonia pacifica]|uniref:Uncharacterized conserved protein YegL, contains vWA domain of TerY type n=1 Tax=Dokdonia pacifica TaxID=1627892 RepID=A0A239AJC7_9FLAO|nr:VWA domain-containing protein [Dokdonia pacifica]GGG37391.1 hypothetical protein GCM10011344_42760 [Dokdonia pacifica]SNR95134.1 Uncharacterized conserved protein YegL, contains vWA domain of TerY type [Dokdonia pacifica]